MAKFFSLVGESSHCIAKELFSTSSPFHQELDIGQHSPRTDYSSLCRWGHGGLHYSVHSRSFHA